MMTSSNGNIFRVTGHLCGEFTDHKGQWRGVLMFSSICAWINDWVNNREAVDLRRHHAHYHVTVRKTRQMCLVCFVCYAYVLYRFYDKQSFPISRVDDYLAQDCGNSIANALELPQSCVKPSIYDMATRIPGGGGYSSSSRAGRLGRTMWPQNSTSVAEIEKGGQNSTMTPPPPTLEKGGSIFYISMKSLQKRGSKIYNSKKYRGQNSTSLKMGVKILHAEK